MKEIPEPGDESSDLESYYSAIKKGHLTALREYIENKRVDIKALDANGNSSIYWACLCGHAEVVKYLLEKGAEYEADSPSGERCYLAAQNLAIRDLLLQINKNFTKSSKQKTKNKIKCPASRLKYSDFLQRFYTLRPNTDISVSAGDDRGHEDGRSEEGGVKSIAIPAHRAIFFVRCEQLSEQLINNCRGQEDAKIDLNQCTSSCLENIVKFLYTSDIECDRNLLSHLTAALTAIGYQHVADDLSDLSVTKQGIITLRKDSYLKKLQQDFLQLAHSGIPTQFLPKVDPRYKLVPVDILAPDIVFNIAGYHFKGYKFFFQDRSRKFKSLLDGKHGETMVEIGDLSPATFTSIMCYVYSDLLQVTEEELMALLIASCEYGLPLLTQRILQEASTFISPQNAVSFYQTSIDTKCNRLTDTALSYIIDHLHQMLQRKDFHQLLSDNKYKCTKNLDQCISDACEEEIISSEEAQRKVTSLNVLLGNLGLKTIQRSYTEPDSDQHSDTSDNSDGTSDSSSDITEKSDEITEESAEITEKSDETTAKSNEKDDDHEKIKVTREVSHVQDVPRNHLGDKDQNPNQNQDLAGQQDVARNLPKNENFEQEGQKRIAENGREDKGGGEGMDRTAVFHFSLDDKRSRGVEREYFQSVSGEYPPPGVYVSRVGPTAGCAGSRSCSIM